ncbi:septation protein SepH [Agromyces seonyuensis]|uniref:DUF3071 domain-containing protein n=1 Tax=Agromyces seonyuensis TaxID=2662446 RepID=A0A6I4NXU6_9MICO|nr:septation protein SepH [Agromyces seonyuensis]MWB97345.1 DUF3071 domain-containing protein [Agromyces seonyuensis]
MQELTVIGVEGGAIVAASDDGERFRIAVDEVLLSRLRTPSAPIPPGSVKLSPREVQARIRSGLSAEDVARVTGADLDYIRRFERPVLAEREHIVTTALAVPVQTIGPFDPIDEPTTFGTAIRERLAGFGASGERWASWKDEETGWMVKLEFTVDGVDRDARWSFDARRQSLVPANPEATTLSQQHEPRPAALIPRLRAVAVEPGDESRFDSGAFAIEAGDVEPQASDAPQARSTSSPAATRAAIKRADEPQAQLGDTADLLEALRRRRGEREAQQQPASPSSGVPRQEPVAEAETPAPVAEPQPLVEVEADAQDDVKQERQRVGNAAARSLWGGKGVATSAPAEPARAQKKGRASMPSWDEIVFGARTDDDLA